MAPCEGGTRERGARALTVENEDAKRADFGVGVTVDKYVEVRFISQSAMHIPLEKSISLLRPLPENSFVPRTRRGRRLAFKQDLPVLTAAKTRVFQSRRNITL